jgi:transposase InsO family protein
MGELARVHRDNYSVYGVKKMHAAMKRRGWHLGREQTRRLMRKAGLRGVQRGKPVFTTVTDPGRSAAGVNRQFMAPEPNRLWVADITFVRTWQILLHGVRHRRLYEEDRRLGGFGDDVRRESAASGVQSCCLAVEYRSV